jgi:dihydroorotate dehydrogenase (fumarate)
MIDLSMKYLGLELSGPVVVGSTPLTDLPENLRQMEDCGASAVIFPSLFEEQLDLEAQALDADLSRGTESFAESLFYLPEQSDYRMSHEVYLEHLHRASHGLDIPVIASLNGNTPGGWIRYAIDLERAGAAAIELNTFALATDASQTSELIENNLVELVSSVCKAVKIPIAVKLSQNFTSLPALAARLEQAGAAGVVLFNRFYQPDFDIEALEVKPTLHFSTPSELLPRLHWAAILYGHIKGDIGITGGVHSAEDVIKAVMAGASMTSIVSALHLHGIGHIASVLHDLNVWLEKHECNSLGEIRGCLSRRSVPDTSAYDRGNYIKTLSSYSMKLRTTHF